jgi:hypothetical protein
VLFVSGVAKVAATKPALLAGVAKYRPGLAHGTTVPAILVRLTELAALVLPVR